MPPQTGDLTMLRGVAGDHSTGALPHDARRTVWAPGRSVSEPGIPNGIASGAMCHYCGCRDMPLIRDFIAEHEQALDCADHVVRALGRRDWRTVTHLLRQLCSSSRRWCIPVEARDGEEETTVRLSGVDRHEFAGVVEGVTACGNTHDVAADLN